MVQSLSHVQLCNPMGCGMSVFPVLHYLPSLRKLMSIEPLMPPNHLILCHSLLLLPSIFPSIRVFSNESALHIRWPKYSTFSFSISPSNEYSRLISFKIDWFDLVVRRTLKRYPGNTFSRDILKIATLINQESLSDICTKNSLIFKPT